MGVEDAAVAAAGIIVLLTPPFLFPVRLLSCDDTLVMGSIVYACNKVFCLLNSSAPSLRTPDPHPIRRDANDPAHRWAVERKQPELQMLLYNPMPSPSHSVSLPIGQCRAFNAIIEKQCLLRYFLRCAASGHDAPRTTCVHYRRLFESISERQFWYVTIGRQFVAAATFQAARSLRRDGMR